MTARVPGVTRDCRCPRIRHEHGGLGAYNRDRCRCDACRAAVREHSRSRRQGPSGWVDGRPAADRIRLLRDAGWTCRDIAAACGLRHETISRIDQQRPARVQARTARAVLALTPATTQAGTRRRVQALAACGWRLRDIADTAGLDYLQIQRILGVQPGRCGRAAQARLRALYEHTVRTGAPPPGGGSPISRARAAAKGWATPMQWDDIDLDPAPAARRRTAADDARQPDPDDWVETDLGPWELARRRHISAASAARWIHNNRHAPTVRAETGGAQSKEPAPITEKRLTEPFQSITAVLGAV